MVYHKTQSDTNYSVTLGQYRENRIIHEIILQIIKNVTFLSGALIDMGKLTFLKLSLLHTPNT